MRFSRIYLVLLALVPISIGAVTIDPQSTLSQVNLLISQYEARIKQLEAENSVLRYEITKANIKIPLIEYSGAIATPLPTALVTSGITFPLTGSVLPSVSTGGIDAKTLTQITTQYGADRAGFISRINKDWTAIKSAYSLPSNARLAGYEFVESGSTDSVFVDITIGTGAKTGVYDMKILYQFEKIEYKRKLIGIFDYSPLTLRYTTRTGSNPFGGVARTFIPDPYYLGYAMAPTTSVVVPSGSTSPVSVTVTSGSTIAGGTVTMADITKAYSEKRYLSTISLSTTYLTSNPATAEILSIRYRTYFITGKYNESLSEIAKMESLGTLDRQTACNAQVIATYSKNQTLVDKYTTICKK